MTDVTPPPDERIRILLCIGKMSAGGSETQLLRLLTHLDRTRFAPELYTVYAGGELASAVPNDVVHHTFEERQPHPSGRLPGAAHRARINDLARLLEQRQIDIVLDRTYHMTLTTAEATRRRPTPRVSIIVSDPERDFGANRERFAWMKRRLLRKAYRTADIAGTVSEAVRQRAASFYRLPIDTFTTMPNLFDLAEIDRKIDGEIPTHLAADPERFRQGRPSRQGRPFRIVACGRLHAAKDYPTLIEAVRRLIVERGRTDVELLILGEGPERQMLERQIAEGGVADHVRLPGYLPNPLPVVASANLFCMTSRYEGMPNALVEALLCEVPVCSTDCDSGPREILRDGLLGELVPVGDVAALTSLLVWHITEGDADLLSRVTTGRTLTIERYGLQAVLPKLEERLLELT